jgi:hypothetical protein
MGVMMAPAACQAATAAGSPLSIPCLGGSRWDDGHPACTATASPTRFLSVVSPKATPCSVSHGVGVNGRARAKAQRDADDGDAGGSRYLLGGVVLALLVLPRLEHQGKP